MATGQLTIAAAESGGPDGARTFGPFTVTTPTAVTETLAVALSSGANTVNVPAGATFAVIIPPNATSPGTPNPNPGYGGTLTLKGVTGDTGTPLSIKWWTVLCWDTAPATIVLTATASANVTIIFA